VAVIYKETASGRLSGTKNAVFAVILTYWPTDTLR